MRVGTAPDPRPGTASRAYAITTSATPARSNSRTPSIGSRAIRTRLASSSMRSSRPAQGCSLRPSGSSTRRLVGSSSRRGRSSPRLSARRSWSAPRAGNLAWARSGRIPRAFGRGCYVYVYNLATGQREVEPFQAEVVRRIFQRFAETRSFSAVSNGLNDESIPQPISLAMPRSVDEARLTQTCQAVTRWLDQADKARRRLALEAFQISVVATREQATVSGTIPLDLAESFILPRASACTFSSAKLGTLAAAGLALRVTMVL